MIQHIFKMMWNRKKRNFLLIAQIFFVFFVLFGLLTVVIKSYKTYTQPLGFDYQNVWVINSSWDAAEPMVSLDRVKRVKEQLKNDPAVEVVSVLSRNTPFSNSSFGFGFDDSLKSVFTYGFMVENEFFEVMKMDVKGSLFDEGMPPGSQWITNRSLTKDLSGDQEAIGRKAKVNPFVPDGMTEIVGKVGNYRYKSTFDAPHNAGFWHLPINERFLDIVTPNFMGSFLIRVKPSATKADERRILEDLQALVPQWEYSIEWLEDRKEVKERASIVPMIVFAIVTLFLLSNVALGLFGVLWYNIAKRKEEIGVRRAMGATASGIQIQFVLEAVMITSFALLAALFFAIQFPVLNVFEVQADIYWEAIGGAVFITLLVTLICALYPSRLAANKQPAMALHEQ